MPAWGNCNVFEKCLSSSQALTLRKTSKFGSPRSNSAIIFKCRSSTQALTLRKTSKIGSPRSNSAINFKCLSSTGTHFAQNLEIRLHPGQPSSGSPVQSSPAQFSPVQPSPRQAPGCPSASQPASQLPNRGIRRGRKMWPRQSGESGKPGVRPATCSKIQNSCRVIADFSSGKSPAPPPPPGAQSAPPPTSSPSPKATGYESDLVSIYPLISSSTPQSHHFALVPALGMLG